MEGKLLTLTSAIGGFLVELICEFEFEEIGIKMAANIMKISRNGGKFNSQSIQSLRFNKFSHNSKLNRPKYYSNNNNWNDFSKKPEGIEGELNDHFDHGMKNLLDNLMNETEKESMKKQRNFEATRRKVEEESSTFDLEDRHGKIPQFDMERVLREFEDKPSREKIKQLSEELSVDHDDLKYILQHFQAPLIKDDVGGLPISKLRPIKLK
eukprot:TRINITY_DN4351_c0_g1_i4.p1 TRINITY_DN4351_c0_g1~~TRINITY_DN4351_c0_g1_i4.p1  ORF type:complete len:210 (-),score=79.23 TRINITY_DN4351_c0_g1_i4:167-796(-)